MRNVLKLVAGTLLLHAGAAFAVVGCPGQVQRIELRANGLVIGDWGYGYKGLCYMNHDINVNGVMTSKDICSSYYAALLTAAASHQQIVTYHNAADCGTAMTETYSDGDNHWMTVPPYGLQIQR